MKIILDMNIPETWEDFLNRAGHDAIHWSRIGDIRAEDSDIMVWARDNGYMVFTHDLDFGSLLFATNAAAPSVLQLRFQHILPEAIGAAVLEALITAAEMLKAGALVTIDPRRHRIRMLPLSRN
ncbi:DUF5615 family PIN-like protein [uncultured Thiodictyon sp.]|uniref:DUF5615 family PIN-like protein n=1 Tax=uncultured Thiodictyon sp. TaxID=1846217 RepID=UPI0025FD503A|nr:DUF5615 family PIN-like protein [uncultured Thiodictyon sp.]